MIGFLKHRVFALENLPSLLFFAIWRSGVGLEHAAWAAAAASAIVLSALWFRRCAPDSILLGINLHFIATPIAIQLVYNSGNTELAREMIDAAGVAVIGPILLTGILVTIFTRQGFVGAQLATPGSTRIRSVILIVWTSAALVWSLQFMGNQFLSVGLPILSTFLMRAALRRRDIRPSTLLPAIALLIARPYETAGRTLRSTINAA